MNNSPPIYMLVSNNQIILQLYKLTITNFRIDQFNFIIIPQNLKLIITNMYVIS